LSEPLPFDPRSFDPTAVGDPRQLAAVRQIVLDDGPERGVRALAFSTGGGLDFWVLADRTMDIGPLWWRGMPVAFEHPSGFVAPGLYDREGDGGTGFERVLSGFLVTCGLDHARQPDAGRPLHGHLPLTPARITRHGADWTLAEPLLVAEGEVVTAHLGRSAFRLARRIEAPIGGTRLGLVDSVQNIGPEPTPLHLLYHLNLGYPAVTPDTRVSLNGAPALAAGGGPSVTCHAVSGTPTARAEAARGPLGPWPGFRLTFEVPSAALPYLQFWSDPRPGRGVVAIEPATSGRATDGHSLPGPVLEPGAFWSTRLDLTFAEEA
jgi:hypothetical protein